MNQNYEYGTKLNKNNKYRD